jgi:hypothetical protein
LPVSSEACKRQPTVANDRRAPQALIVDAKQQKQQEEKEEACQRVSTHPPPLKKAEERDNKRDLSECVGTQRWFFFPFFSPTALQCPSRFRSLMPYPFQVKQKYFFFHFLWFHFFATVVLFCFPCMQDDMMRR